VNLGGNGVEVIVGGWFALCVTGSRGKLQVGPHRGPDPGDFEFGLERGRKYHNHGRL